MVGNISVRESESPVLGNSRADEIADGFAHLRVVDPVLRDLIDRRPDYEPDAWLATLPAMDLYGCVVLQILGQQISIRAADAILARLVARFDSHMPTPAQLLTLDEQSLRDIGMSWRKARTVLDLSARFVDGRLSEADLSRRSDDEIIEALTEVPGIGPWTVHGALLIVLHRADVVPIGDISLRNAMKQQYRLDQVPTEKEALEIAEPWHPFGSLGTNLLFAAAELD